MIREFIEAFLLVFVAEMGDKTQILAMTFATQFTILEVLIGIGLGVFFNHGIAIVLGIYLSKFISLDYIQIGAGLLFVLFAFITLIDNEDEEIEGKSNKKNPIVTVALAFFIGELGDKTQLAAMSLSAESNFPFIVLLATTSAMICINSFSIYIGSKIGKSIPEKIVTITSSIIFLVFGSIKLYKNIPENYLTSGNILLYLIILVGIELTLIKQYKKELSKKESKADQLAELLYEQTKRLNISIDNICLGIDQCQECLGKDCLIGSIKFILKDSRENRDFYKRSKIDYDSLLEKNYDVDKILEAYEILVEDYKVYGWDLEEDFIVNDIKSVLEKLLSERNINYKKIN